MIAFFAKLLKKYISTDIGENILCKEGGQKMKGNPELDLL